MPTVPDSYPIEIMVNSVDVTAYCPYDKITFEDYALSVSSFRFTMENPSFTPQEGHLVGVYRTGTNGENQPAVFAGIIMEVNQKKRDNAVIYDYEIEALDNKVFLQKSVVEYNEFTGADTTILDDLLTAAYPDLTDAFDFASNATGFIPGMDFVVDDDSLLDALRDFQDQTGGSLSFDRDPINYTIRFEGADIIDEFVSTYPAYAFGAVTSPLPTFEGVGTGGNPSHCFVSQGTGALTTLTEYIPFTIFLRNPFSTAIVRFVSISFDLWFSFNGQDCRVDCAGESSTFSAASYAGQWITVNFTDLNPSGFPFDDNTIQIELRPAANMASAAWEVRLDNIRLKVINPSKEKANYKDTPDPTEWDLDIPTSEEYAFNVDFSQGTIDGANSITVIGGNEAYSATQIYGLNGTEFYLDLPAPMKSLTVFKNTGSDVSLTWTAQSKGEFGTDQLSSEGGTKDVLYDAKDHFLIFNTAPPNLTNSVKVTGTIEKPIRVRVESVASGAKTYATTLFNDKITTSAEAAAYGAAELKKRRTRKNLTFVTYNPGLQVGKKIRVTDAARGLDETIKIQKIITTWIGSSGHAVFEVECGEDEISTSSFQMAATDKKAKKKAKKAQVTTTTLDLLLDEDGTPLNDADGELLIDG